VEIYDTKQNQLFPSPDHVSPIELVPKQSNVATVIACTGLWMGGKGWGVTWKVVQCVVKPQVMEKVFGKCHIQLSDADVEAIEDKKEPAPVPVVAPAPVPAPAPVAAPKVVETPKKPDTYVADSDEEGEAPAPVAVAPAPPKVLAPVVAPVPVPEPPVEEVAAPEPVAAEEPKKKTVVKKIVKKAVPA